MLRSRSTKEGRYIAIETLISVVTNVVLAATFTNLMFGGQDFALRGPGGLAADFVPATFLLILPMTAGLTWVTHKRSRAGKAPSLVAPPLPLPTNPVLRGWRHRHI